MGTTATPEAVAVTVPARAAAIGWLNAFLAASQEEDRPALYRTLSVETFENGVQFVGCDGTALFRAWVPVYEGAAFPEVEEAPDRAVVVMDPDGFGLGFMRALVRVTGDEGHAADELTITTAPHDDEATIPLGAEFMTERLTLRACGQRIDLRLFEGAYPNWRVLKLGAEDAMRVDGMTVAARLLALIGKLKGVGPIDLSFHGETRHVGFAARGEFEVRGLIMPMTRPAAAARG